MLQQGQQRSLELFQRFAQRLNGKLKTPIKTFFLPLIFGALLAIARRRTVTKWIQAAQFSDDFRKAVKVSAFLFAVNLIVGRINVNDDLFRRFFVGLDEQFDKKFGAVGKFFVVDSIFESRESGSGAEGLFVIGGILDGGEQSGVFSEFLMVVAVFVTEGDGVDALSEEVALLMFGEKRIAGIVDDPADAFGESKFLIDPLKKNRTGIGGEFAAVELDGDGLGLAGCGEGGVVIHCVLVVCV